MINIDESSIAKDQAMRKYGRALAGEKATVHQSFEWDGVGRSLFGALTVRGMYLDSCKLIEGNVSDEEYFDYFAAHCAPHFNEYNGKNENRCGLPACLPTDQARPIFCVRG